jgi:broad specificity phosphatase PhoE
MDERVDLRTGDVVELILNSKEKFDAIYSSDLQRDLLTAQLLLDERGIPLVTDARLREIGFGEWEGEIFHDMLAKYPERFALSRNDPALVMAPGGESVAQVAERTAFIADEIARLYPLGQVLIVTHGMALATLVCRAKGFDLAGAYEHVPDNAQPVEINWESNTERK